MSFLPSTQALRMFEAAARHGSFTRAASELHITPAAVSFQIRALEGQLGVSLFHRLTNSLVLTDYGQTYLPEVRRVLESLIAATDRIRKEDASGIITVSTAPCFAARWLLPRLRRFLERHPRLDVRVASSLRFPDFASQNIDVGLCYGQGGWEGMRAELFLTSNLFPVCNPKLIRRDKPLREPSDLRHYTLLHSGINEEDWPKWFNAAGVEDIDISRGPRFNDVCLALQAAIEGYGVALGRSALTAIDLATGRLVRPFDLSLPADRGHYFVCPKDTVGRLKVKLFREWIFAEVGQEAIDPDPHKAAL